MEVTVWYPAEPEATDEIAVYEPTTLSSQAYKNPKAAIDFAPMIAFSHGYFSVRFQSAFLVEHLASHGFATVVDHVHNTMFDFDDDLTGQVLLERPDDLRYATQEARRRSANREGYWVRFDRGRICRNGTLLWIPYSHGIGWGSTRLF